MFDVKKILIGSTIGFLGLLGLYVSCKKGNRSTVTERDVKSIDAFPMRTKIMKERFHDLTLNISKDTVLFPGDPIFCCKNLSSLKNGDAFELQNLSFGNHTGTHIDFPSHVMSDGKNSSDFSINDLIGDGIIIEVPNQRKSIKKKDIQNISIQKNDFVFFKTSNSELLKKGIFDENFVYIEPEAAKMLLEKKVKVVGIDYLSPDKIDAEDLPVHKILLSNNILIVEGLNLHGIHPGRCKIYIMPLKVPNLDGLPARVIMENK
jgi:arylformamidase